MNVNIVERLVRLCLDDTRHILYSLSENGSIQVYDLRADGNSIVKVASLSYGQIQVQFYINLFGLAKWNAANFAFRAFEFETFKFFSEAYLSRTL